MGWELLMSWGFLGSLLLISFITIQIEKGEEVNGEMAAEVRGQLWYFKKLCLGLLFRQIFGDVLASWGCLTLSHLRQSGLQKISLSTPMILHRKRKNQHYSSQKSQETFWTQNLITNSNSGRLPTWLMTVCIDLFTRKLRYIPEYKVAIISQMNINL